MRVVTGLLLVLCLSATAVYAEQQNFGKELASLDFGNIIGGPLRAIVNAQLLASKETINFIQSVGFQPDPEASGSGEAATVTRTVDFSYNTISPDGTERLQTLTVPLLTMVPIPYLQFETIDITFSVTLGNIDNISTSLDVGFGGSGGTHSTATTGSGSDKTTTSTTMSGSVSAKYSINANSSYQQTYAMNIHVAARQSDMPEGTMKLIDKLTSIIRSTVRVSSASS